MVLMLSGGAGVRPQTGDLRNRYGGATENDLTLEHVLRLYLVWEKDGASLPDEVEQEEVFSLFQFPDRLPLPLKNYIHTINAACAHSDSDAEDSGIGALMPTLLDSKYMVKNAKLRKLRAAERRRKIAAFLRELCAYFDSYIALWALTYSIDAHIEKAEFLIQNYRALDEEEEEILMKMRDKLQMTRDDVRQQRDQLDDRRLPSKNDLRKIETKVTRRAMRIRAIERSVEAPQKDGLAGWWKRSRSEENSENENENEELNAAPYTLTTALDTIKKVGDRMYHYWHEEENDNDAVTSNAYSDGYVGGKKKNRAHPASQQESTSGTSASSKAGAQYAAPANERHAAPSLTASAED